MVEGPRVVRVLPDVVGIDKAFHYAVPDAWHRDGRALRIAPGSMVRVRLHGRRVGGWVVAIDERPPAGVNLAPLSKLSGIGPAPHLLELTEWAAHRWAGRRVHFLRAASPRRSVAGVAERAATSRVASGPGDGFDEAFELGTAVVRLPPAADPLPLALAAARRGDALVIVPELERARHLAISLRRAGATVALGPDQWARAAAGATVVGTRSAAWMPMPHLAAVLVIDEHHEALQEERAPTWHAREVVLERARRLGAPAVLASPVPSLEALRSGPMLKPARAVERDGWPVVQVVDKRSDDPARGALFGDAVVPVLRDGGRVLCVLNRLGRSRLLACSACGEIARTDDGSSALVLIDDELCAPDGGQARPVVCAHCGSTKLKNLRMGVTRAVHDLRALLGEPVDEVTAKTSSPARTRVVIGTEATLHRLDAVDTVVFLDFDQELLAQRQRAAEQALALIARAARLIGARAAGRRLVIQTRQPDHAVVQAALRADPSLVAVAERDRRRALQIPPYSAQALVSGAAAEEFIAALGRADGVRVRGPAQGRWLLRAATHETLLDALSRTPRPPGRLRIEVDPLRA